jgi:DNA-binding MarR family transcriptional regulator
MAPDRDDFGVLLAMAYVTFVDELVENLAGYERFGPWAGFVLRAVDDEPISLRELADRLEMTSPGALKIIDPMLDEGYLERVSDPADRRVRAIALTPKGREALAAARAFHAEFESSLAEQLGADAVAAARGTLEAIVARNSTRVPRLFRAPKTRGGEAELTGSRPRRITAARSEVESRGCS